MKMLHATLIAAPVEDGDKAIRSTLMSTPTDNFKALDNAINDLLKTYTLTQIYKVYYKTFGG